MKKVSPLVVPGVEEYLNEYKEEIAHEFGMYRSHAELEQQSHLHDVTKKLLKRKKTEKSTGDKNDSC
ncbi:small, acid-soluble spore protein, alpha/beta type [Bacillus sp. A301a_S52]|nr:small, acid-soluble spore protein, alpha/beta type [Bacillus sp. A301a_S52]